MRSEYLSAIPAPVIEPLAATQLIVRLSHLWNGFALGGSTVSLLREVLVTPAASSLRLAASGGAAVACADIVGYTILMGADPVATHGRWMRLLSTVLRPEARARGSRVVKSTGDGVLADFPTVSDALAWANAVHAATQHTDDAGLPPVAFRIAIAAGEIEATDEDIYGDCVNVAARLQELAPPGGIAITETARAELRDPPRMDDLGTLHLRHIAAPVHTFVQRPAIAPRVPARAPPLGTPSVAVMPFANVGNDPTQAYLVSGIIEDIILSLGALRDLAVIARGATLVWASGQFDPATIGRVLGVRYMVTGSLRHGPDHLRLTVALRETTDGETLWSDRIEARKAELFAVQDEIVARIVAGIAPSIKSAELRRALRTAPTSLNAYDHTLRGMYALDSLRRETFAEAAIHFDQAMRVDPGFAMPVGWAARWHSFAYAQSWGDRPGTHADRWVEMAGRAVQLDANSAMGNAMMGHHRAYVLHDPAGALPWFDRALDSCPNHAPALSFKSGTLAYMGRGAEAVPLAERAHALAPVGPERYYYLCFVGLANLAAGKHDIAQHWLRLSLTDNPQFTAAHRFLIAALHAEGKLAEAREVALKLMREEPALTVSAYASGRQPFVDPVLAARLLQALRDAGVPD
jgi:adenylate cyclase